MQFQMKKSGIHALTSILKANEKEAIGEDLKNFLPKVKPAEEWHVD